MALTLQHVAARQGLTWVRDGFATFARRPMAFTGLFAVFLVAALLLISLPYIGAVLLLAAMPLLSMGFMIGTRNALQGGPVQPGLYLQALGGDPTQRRAMALLCLSYALCSVMAFSLSDQIDGGTFTALQVAMSRSDAPQAEIDALLNDPRLATGMLLRVTLASLLSVPYWHAPALVCWGGQGLAQALFSSALAVWRNKGAFAVYSLGWTVVVMGFSLAVGVLLGLLGGRSLVGLVAVPAGLVFSAAFYVSLLFTFNDSFGAGTDTAWQDPGDASTV